MRTLLKSFSLAALFSLATACAVDEDTTQISDEASSDDSLGEDEGGVDLSTLDPRERENKTAETKPMSDLGEHLDDVDLQYCEQNDDCKSNICDQRNNVCRDYPF